MYMHSLSEAARLHGAAAEPPALVFRTALDGAASLAWRNRRVRVDEDAWLLLDGREACTVQIEPEVRARLLVVAVSRAERDAAFAAGAGTKLGVDDAPQPDDDSNIGIGISDPAGFGFAENLRSRDGAAGLRLLAIARGRAAGRSPSAERPDRIALVRDAIAEELALHRRAARLDCVKLATREQLLRRILLAADFIASHHDEPLSLDEIARAASLSRFHFVRLFSLVLGETPHAFLLRKRTAVARRHLAVGSACSEAATRAGFGSRSALFRNLRKTDLNATGHESCFLSA
jgi:AraC family transcriptional regulator